MDKQGYITCPVCHGKNIKKAKLYSYNNRECGDCKSEWTVETHNSRFELIFNFRKEFVL